MGTIGQREINPILQKLFDEKKNVYSISKLNTIDNCEYEAWNTYIDGKRGKNGVYGVLGTRIHDTLEDIINNKSTEKDLLPALELELSDLDMLDIDFPKDFKGGTSIRDNWIADMKHFCMNFQRPKGKFTTEKFILYKINDDRYVQGYIDLIRNNNDDTVSIYDWKTSTNFSKEDLLHHGRQLIFYALALEQEGYKVKNVSWIMIKYVEISFMGKARKNSKNNTLITKVINRGKLIKELQPYLELDLEEMGFGEVEIEIFINESLSNNSLDNLPKEICDKYKIKPYIRNYELTDELKNETLDYINKIADIFESKSKNEKSWKHREFVKSNGKPDTFFCNTLCNHRETCKYIRKYNETALLMKTNDEDLF